MPLTQYKKKRSFDQTPEPEGKKAAKGKALRFVVQRHEATRLHYDFRLELNGVMLSWAVPKGPSLNPDDKRLAVHVEDHPVEYNKFTGDIPKGNYGAGHVAIWDEGTYTPTDEKGNPISDSDFTAAYKEGNMKFRMKGHHVEGSFHLFRLKNEEKNWLLVKGRDAFSIDDEYDIESIKPIRDKKSKAAPKEKAASAKKKAAPLKKESLLKPAAKAVNKELATARKLRTFVHPMTAKLHDAAFNDPDWIFEIKWDGYRAIAECAGADTRFYSRNGISFLNAYQQIADALRAMKSNAILDGEVVALDEDGKPNFQSLQNAAEGKSDLYYYVFDLLEEDGKSTEKKTLLERKQRLQELLPNDHGVIRFCDHVVGAGKEFFRIVQKQGLEGMIAKRAKSSYQEGRRSGDWLKVKHNSSEEAVIAGYTEGRGSRKHFGALVLGEYEDGQLKYIGHTGTGFTDSSLKSLHAQMQELVTDESPFETKVPINNPVTWLRPELVCQVKFSERTSDGILRHPVFQGLRIDKPAEDVDHADAEQPVKKSEAKKAVAKKAASKRAGSKEAAPKKAVARNAASKKADPKEDAVKAGNQKLVLSNTDKIYWPDEGITKGDMLAYYDAISKYILPYLKGRPLSLRRQPGGINDPGFFHKDVGEHAPEWIRKEVVWSDSSNKNINYLVVDDKPSLLYVANLGSIEMNPWHGHVGSLDEPDYLVIDLDPSDKNTFEQVIETAQAVKQVLDEAGAAGYCKTSGATGLHIYLPLHAQYSYDQCVAFAELIAIRSQALLPDFTSLERSLKKRGDKIYIDYLQNRRSQTVACAYSVRPKPGATVSAPLEWKEVKKGLDISKFNIRTMLKRIEQKGDLFKGVLGKGINMEACLRRLAR